MVYALLAAVIASPVTAGVCLWLLASRGHAHQEQIRALVVENADRLASVRADHDARVDSLLALLAGKDQAHMEQVERLCQRLQAPERAVIQHEQQTSTPGGTVEPMTDQEYEEQQEQLRAAILEIERVENEGVLS